MIAEFDIPSLMKLDNKSEIINIEINFVKKIKKAKLIVKFLVINMIQNQYKLGSLSPNNFIYGSFWFIYAICSDHNISDGPYCKI